MQIHIKPHRLGSMYCMRFLALGKEEVAFFSLSHSRFSNPRVCMLLPYAVDAPNLLLRPLSTEALDAVVDLSLIGGVIRRIDGVSSVTIGPATYITDAAPTGSLVEYALPEDWALQTAIAQEVDAFSATPNRVVRYLKYNIGYLIVC